MNTCPVYLEDGIIDDPRIHITGVPGWELVPNRDDESGSVFIGVRDKKGAYARIELSTDAAKRMAKSLACAIQYSTVVE